ncbi:MAG: BrnT family toxin [Rickettsiales bacterium]|jgi:uncharacterized DUF497 family protein|nr:BrnT family toxin [Rickettsiales bacterium]
MNFEWDENKRKSNLEKHGLDFLRASRVFKDSNRIEQIDNRKEYGEIRIQVIGKIRLFLRPVLVAFVVYTGRGGKKRIISARPASKEEKVVYYGNR